MLSVLICATFIVAIVQASENVIFDDQFNDQTLSPGWVISPGRGSYSLTNHSGYLRYIIDANHVNPAGTGDYAKAMWLIRPFSGDQWILKTVLFYNMRPDVPTNGRDTALVISAPGEVWGASDEVLEAYIHRGVGESDDNPYSNNLRFGAFGKVDHYIYFPNSPNPLPIERWYFEIERNKDNFIFKGSNDGNDATFEYEHEFTIPPGSLGNDQELGILGWGWYGSNNPPGYVDFDYIKVVPTINTSVNLIKNPGFESGTAPWIFYTNGKGSFTTVSPGYEGNRSARLAIVSAGNNTQLYQKDITLEPNTRYRLSFAANSTRGHDVKVKLLKHISPFTPYGLDQTFNLGTNWQEYSVTFTTTGFTSTVNNGRLMFYLVPFAVAGDKYYIDNVRLSKV